MFRRAYRLSLEVHRASLEFPRIEQFALADQIRRASQIDLRQSRRRVRQAASVCGPEFRRFLMMAIGSADEMQVWTLYCRDLGYIEEPMWPSTGRASTGRSPACCRASIARSRHPDP